MRRAMSGMFMILQYAVNYHFIGSVGCSINSFLTCTISIPGMGEEHTAKFKLRMGLNLRSYKAYAKLRFRTEPISPFDIGEGLSCAGKVWICILLYGSIQLCLVVLIHRNVVWFFLNRRIFSISLTFLIIIQLLYSYPCQCTCYLC